MRQFSVKNRQALIHDLLYGCMVALLSIPLSMGYAQVAGLPPQYGLYGSFLPVLVYALLTTSPRMVFGVDAAPAALVAALLPELGIAAGSPEAVSAMAVITFLTGIWLLCFRLLRAGRFAKFVSESVLGGCVSGIAAVVILTQFPRLFGGTVTAGRAPVLIVHLVHELKYFHPLSFLIGLVTVVFILIGRRRVKTSLAVIAMLAGSVCNAVLHLEQYGVAAVSPLPHGLPRFVFPDFSYLTHHTETLLVDTLAVALVIAAETLVSTGDFGRKYNDTIDNQREVLACAAGNLTAALFGSSPAIGSLARTNYAVKAGVNSQWMSVSMLFTMGIFLLCGTPFLSYLPVPVLTGIIIASLCTILEFGTAKHLWKADRSSFFVFMAAFAAEMLGLAEGVIVGLVLSFASFTMQASAQPSYFLGCMEGHEGFFDLSQTPHAKPIEQTVIYQFNGPLFFASVEDFEHDLLRAIRPDTLVVVVTGISSVDIFAAERLVHFYHKLKKREIAFFVAGHAAAVNERLMGYGAAELIHDGVVRQRLTQALNAGGLTPPYPLEQSESEPIRRGNAAVEAFMWAYGQEALPRLGKLANQLAEDVLNGREMRLEQWNPAEQEVAGEFWNSEDEKEYLGLLDMYLAAGDRDRQANRQAYLAFSLGLMEHRMLLERQLLRSGNQSVLWRFLLFQKEREADLREKHPELGTFLDEQRHQYMSLVRQEDAELAGLVENFHSQNTFPKTSAVNST